MAREVGDLWPQVSGSASLGAEMRNGGFTGAIRPFAHVHMDSGIFHSSLIDNSGIIRLDTGKGLYNAHAPSFSFSFNGGNNFPLEIGGNAAQPVLEAAYIETPRGDLRLTASGTLTLLSLNSDIGVITNSDTVISVFNNSGVLHYEFGPHQAWYVKASHSNTGGPFNDGFWPIAHSGNVAQMIASSTTTLQQAYVAGRSIITRSLDGGPVLISGQTAVPLRLETAEDSLGHIEMLGLLRSPTEFQKPGTLVLMSHGLNLDNPFVASITGQNMIAAKSAGIPTLWLHCGGSGTVAIRTASGVSQFFNIFASNAITETGLNVPFLDPSQSVPDRFLKSIAGSGIQVLVPGLYKILYAASLEKTAGELAQQVNIEIRINDIWGQTFKIIGGNAFSTVRDSASPINTAHGQSIIDVNSGEVLNIFGYLPLAPVPPNSVRFGQRLCNVIVEYLGPQRGISTVRLKVT